MHIPSCSAIPFCEGKEELLEKGGNFRFIVEKIKLFDGLVWFMVFNTTFNNISVTSWQPVLLVEETGVP